ncbi:5-oxoprolinase/urea amidolyase family protein, partial [Alloalcanivorax venustensis]|uniref:5-oxoprolinase/urea amidolyase family protein n=1 Tax=Alloalcanivorax venustensis TaxID=172371 RepID=UPI003C3C6D69
QKSFADGVVSTRALESFEFKPSVAEVVKPGTYTTVQDYPGRAGYWDIGVPPSGPMDDYAFRLGNRIVGNHASAAGLETTLVGPSLKFHSDTVVALTGAACDAELDGAPVPMWQPVPVKAGQTLTTGKASSGCRTYIAVRNGIDVPDYLGSKATFVLGQFGGHGGRTLRKGDVLSICQPRLAGCPTPAPEHEPAPMPQAMVPDYPQHWDIKVLYGPHGAPDFFTEEAIEQFFEADWQVHYNSSRTGIRLVGPKPEWARSDGGEAGMHPSNIHDNAYAVGTVDFTGDMPVILGPDGPSLGGFVCPATVISADRWKLGQLKAGDRLRFVPLSLEDADRLAAEQDACLAGLSAPTLSPAAAPVTTPILDRLEEKEDGPEVVYRAAGDRYLLVEYGPLELDLRLRFRAHALMLWLEEEKPDGILELTPGIRSLQVHFEPSVLPRRDLLEMLKRAELTLDKQDDLEVPSRIVHLPLSWDDEACRLAIEKYMQSVRKDAPWCPSNIEFIRRINGLDSIDEVKKILFDASYVVMGLGDVYLGAPVATPYDPRHRLVTTKYNPARTWTAENSVGIGGSYLCVYGMEGPGGYQFVGRTMQMWNRFHRTEAFTQPWLLRFFDQVRYYPVSEEELAGMRDAFREGRLEVEITEETFSLAEHRR